MKNIQNGNNNTTRNTGTIIYQDQINMKLNQSTSNKFLNKKKKRKLSDQKKKNHDFNNKPDEVRKNSDRSEKGFKIIFSDYKDTSDEIENNKADQHNENVITIKKRKEIKITTNKQLQTSKEILKDIMEIEKEENLHVKNNARDEKKISIKEENPKTQKEKRKKEKLKEDKNKEEMEIENPQLKESNGLLSFITTNQKSDGDGQSLFTQDFIKIPKDKNVQPDPTDILPSRDVAKSEFDTIRKSYPWIKRKTEKLRGIFKLHQEILDFYEFIKPTAEEDEFRAKTVKIVKNLILAEWPDWTVKEFGSFPNKIHLPDSDVDIIVLTGKESSADQNKILKKITKILVQADCVDYIQLIGARVPIIKATLKETKINLDIRKNGYEAKKVIKHTLNDFPFMRPLIYVLKYFLRQRKLNESYTGGISSFLLFNLLLAYVQYLSKENQLGEKINLGTILVGFFQFYGFDFNFEDVGISVRYGGYFFKKSDSNCQGFKPNGLLSVENFQELDQDIGKSAFKFRKVLNCFKQARDSLYYPSKFPLESYLGQFIDVDKFLIDRYSDYSDKRNKTN